MSTQTPVLPTLQFFDSNGDPLSGGKLYTYEAGTNTPKATYTDEAGVVPNSNPIILDGAGYATIRIASGNYKFVLYDANDNLQFTADDVSSTGSIISSVTGALIDSNNLSDLDDVPTALANLGLENVDNTSDADKPISDATQTALDAKVDDSQIIDEDDFSSNSSSHVPTQQSTKSYVDALESYVDSQDGLLVPKSVATTKGDILAATASAVITRVGVGPNGYVLTCDNAESAGVKWASPSAGSFSGGDFFDEYAAKTSNYTVLATDYFLAGDSSGGAFAFTMPTGVTGNRFIFKKTDSSFNAITITGVTTLNTQGEVVTLIYSGSAWVIENRYISKSISTYTPTMTNVAGTAYGTWARSGRYAHIKLRLDFTGTSTGNVTVTLPSGLSADSTAYPGGVINYFYGSAVYVASTTSLTVMFPFVTATGTTVQFYTPSGVLASGDAVNADYVNAEIFVPISGWNG